MEAQLTIDSLNSHDQIKIDLRYFLQVSKISWKIILNALAHIYAGTWRLTHFAFNSWIILIFYYYQFRLELGLGKWKYHMRGLRIKVRYNHWRLEVLIGPPNLFRVGLRDRDEVFGIGL